MAHDFPRPPENVDVYQDFEYPDPLTSGLTPEMLEAIRNNRPELSLPPIQLDTEVDMPWVPYGPEQPDTGVIEQLMQGSEPTGSGWADAASVFAAMGQGAKADRTLAGPLTQGYDRLRLQAEAQRADLEKDALKKLAITNYLTSGGSKFDMSSLPYQYGGPPRPPGEAQVEGAKTLQAQLLKRMQEGGTYMPTPHEKYTQPGTLEKIGQYGGLATGGIGTIEELLKRRGGDTGGGIPWGKVGGGIVSGLKTLGGLFKRG